MRRIVRFLATLSLVAALSACGSSGTNQFGADSGDDPNNCKGDAPTEISIAGSDLQVNMGREPYSGSLILTALKTQVIDSAFEDPFVGGTVNAQGHFVGIRFKVKSDLSSALQPSSVIFDNMQITDGERSWAIADYNGTHSDAPSWAWSVNQGDEQGATDVGAGFENYTWALFDIPKDAKPTAIAYQSEGPQYCLGLPVGP